MKNKKSGSIVIGMVIFLFIGVVLVSVLLPLLGTLFGKGGSETVNFLDSGGDYDKDGTANYYDKCACKIGSRENEGCPKDLIDNEDALKQERETCAAKMNAEKIGVT